MLSQIKDNFKKLSNAEQRVASLVLQDPGVFSALPVVELASRAQVSKPTVVRFCRSLGYAGLREFKLKLAAHANDGLPFIHRSVNPLDTTDNVLVKTVDNALAMMQRYRNTASVTAIDKAASVLTQVMKDGRRLEFYGVGNSGIVAQDAQHKFFRMGFHTIAHSDTHLQIMSASQLRQGDCVVLVSNSGHINDLIKACNIASKNGVYTIAITASNSPLAKVVDTHLAADHLESFEQYSPMESRLLHLIIIDVLTTTVALQIGSETLQPKLQQMKQNLLIKQYS